MPDSAEKEIVNFLAMLEAADTDESALIHEAKQRAANLELENVRREVLELERQKREMLASLTRPHSRPHPRSIARPRTHPAPGRGKQSPARNKRAQPRRKGK